MKHQTLPLLAAVFTAAAAQAATFEFAGSLRSSDNTAPPVEPLLTAFGFDFFAWRSVDNGQGALTAHAGFTSFAGIAPADITVEFGDLELIGMVLGGGFGTQTYGDTDAGPSHFDVFVEGVKVATGTDFGLTVVTDIDSNSPGFTLATGTGTVTLQEVGGHPFVSEMLTLQGDTVLRLELGTFVAPVVIFHDRSPANFNDYAFTGGGTVVPEPSALGLIAVGGALLGWRNRRRDHR